MGKESTRLDPITCSIRWRCDLADLFCSYDMFILPRFKDAHNNFLHPRSNLLTFHICQKSPQFDIKPNEIIRLPNPFFHYQTSSIKKHESDLDPRRVNLWGIRAQINVPHWTWVNISPQASVSSVISGGQQKASTMGQGGSGCQRDFFIMSRHKQLKLHTYGLIPVFNKSKEIQWTNMN